MINFEEITLDIVIYLGAVILTVGLLVVWLERSKKGK